MIRLYLDTEFTALRLDRQLISLALVSSTGAEFYVELLDGWAPDACSEFTRSVVLPQLDVATWGLPRQEAAAQLRTFLEAQGDCEILGDALDWDWPLLLELLGPAGLPESVQGCRALTGSQFENVQQQAPEPPHHALEDARWLRRLAESMTSQA
ncbi:3'-5' exoribonuclease [Metapseudomonas furukawaii]|uniref:3'-5' exoribonuclease n=1 Tax=Metapseudomonas furukawaii TaxID=1149133 RepID=UPI00227D6719|nr:3'-5' exoribonuclease [Pseudomonas furukawaii]WAG79110.1 3'-5' exoribonuclease [Pseudomonas furukawaii]